MKALRRMLGYLAGACGFTVAVLLNPAVRAADLEPAPVTVYDNTVNSLDSQHGVGGKLEFGDEIVMGGYPDQGLLNVKYFEFSYSTTDIFVESPSKVGWLRFYALDGDPVSNAGGVPSNSPGSLLMDPIKFTLYEGGAYVFIPSLSFEAPRRMAWTVSFDLLAVGEDVGLDLYDPVAMGQSGKDFWVKEDGTWHLREIAGGAIPANFYARVLAIPEPTVLSLGAVAALGFLAMGWMRRRA
jgi:hypothetical protein